MIGHETVSPHLDSGLARLLVLPSKPVGAPCFSRGSDASASRKQSHAIHWALAPAGLLSRPVQTLSPAC